MTVEELIQLLQTHDPKLKVMIEYTDPTDWTYQSYIRKKDIEVGINDNNDQKVLIFHFYE